MKIQFNNNADLKESVEYLRKNLNCLYIKFVEKNNKLYLQLDPNTNVGNQIFEHDKELGNDLADFNSLYPLSQNNICGELHIFKENILIIRAHHAIVDGRFMQQLLNKIELKDPIKLQIPQAEHQIFKKEIEIYKEKLFAGQYNYKYMNQQKLIDDQDEEPLLQIVVKLDLKKYSWLQHKLTQRLMILNILCRLYVFQKQRYFDYCDYYLQYGLAIEQELAVDARKYAKVKDNFGSCTTTVNVNYMLKGSSIVKQLCQELQDITRADLNNYKQYAHFCQKSPLDMLLDQQKIKQMEKEKSKKGRKKDTKEKEEQQMDPYLDLSVIHGFVFSNVGQYKSNVFKDISLECHTKDDLYNFVISWCFTLNNTLTIVYHCPQSYKRFHLEKVIQYALESMNDDINIQKLWQGIEKL